MCVRETSSSLKKEETVALPQREEEVVAEVEGFPRSSLDGFRGHERRGR